MLTLHAAADAPWKEAQAELAEARRGLASAPAGIVRQGPFDRVAEAERRSTDLVHQWFASALELQPVMHPRLVLSLDVDGVLEDESEGFSSTTLAGAGALKLMQLGRVAVLLNTARSVAEVRRRVETFQLLGGVGGFGSSVWDGLFGRDICLISDRSAAQLDRVRAALRANPAVVVDSSYDATLRVSVIRDRSVRPIVGSDARGIADRTNATDLTFWVAPRHTDFVDRGVDKGAGLERLRDSLGLSSLPLAAMGDASCDLPMLRAARIAFLPAATLPSFMPARGQRLIRSRHLGDQALWDAACHLVPNTALQRSVLSRLHDIDIPAWIPWSRRQPPAAKGLFPRLAAAFTSIRND